MGQAVGRIFDCRGDASVIEHNGQAPVSHATVREIVLEIKDNHLKHTNEKIDVIDERMAGLDSHIRINVSRLDDKVDRLENKVDRLELKVGGIDGKLDILIARA